MNSPQTHSVKHYLRDFVVKNVSNYVIAAFNKPYPLIYCRDNRCYQCKMIVTFSNDRLGFSYSSTNVIVVNARNMLVVLSLLGKFSLILPVQEFIIFTLPDSFSK